MQLTKEFVNDYKALAQENEELKRELTKLELKLQMIEKALDFLADGLDEAYLELGFRANNQYLLKQILSK